MIDSSDGFEKLCIPGQFKIHKIQKGFGRKINGRKEEKINSNLALVLPRRKRAAALKQQVTPPHGIIFKRLKTTSTLLINLLRIVQVANGEIN